MIVVRLFYLLLGRLGIRELSGAEADPARLFAENFRRHWLRYALAFVLMAIAAGATALSATIIKYVVDEIFIAHNLNMLVPLSMGIVALSFTKGFASYFQEVVLGRLGNRIVAENQGRVPATTTSSNSGVGPFHGGVLEQPDHGGRAAGRAPSARSSTWSCSASGAISRRSSRFSG